MKNFKYFIFVALILLFIIVIFFLINNNNSIQNYNSVSGTRTSAILNENNNDTDKNNTKKEPTPVEEEISSFQTKILDNSSGRLTNIQITCSIINNKIIKNGETFSFNEIVGQPTSQRGYKEAKVIVNGHAVNGIGGGNCQVSTTIYNAVLNVPNLTVTERSDHGGKDVGYIQVGKDAAVSYGSLDLKFRNDTGNDIKILATTDNKVITIKINRITYK